ncbi:hypothetical protein GCM10010990_34530 [Croceicoccus mobilis]|uniref:Uncharacterized protein n=1 Tax=Croceicoccus mobilis TaxID=1703339 RepID=A0A916Z8P3_9SPHN|nr:hypothetical protein GCM10010990_34530 [Croceicoccus mobilis]
MNPVSHSAPGAQIKLPDADLTRFNDKPQVVGTSLLKWLQIGHMGSLGEQMSTVI